MQERWPSVGEIAAHLGVTLDVMCKWVACDERHIHEIGLLLKIPGLAGGPLGQCRATRRRQGLIGTVRPKANDKRRRNALLMHCANACHAMRGSAP
jgi:hypothetical protein